MSDNSLFAYYGRVGSNVVATAYADGAAGPDAVLAGVLATTST